MASAPDSRNTITWLRPAPLAAYRASSALPMRSSGRLPGSGRMVATPALTDRFNGLLWSPTSVSYTHLTLPTSDLG